ncbi:plasmid pRiA4b ORF-3 family protein [Kribbia dieselivorans]|uniref:plasmid pRiA4b ORF-3 family protein n=1 Tax=Kribbia dieselivorans TaxID=331526 RepID=UPI000A93E291|nr:plasmid pRiA4b ORF-3 family protein [Kribbia dieselivorans]
MLRGFRVRLDLLDTMPVVWRRLDLPGDITLPTLHDVIQAAMGWADSHLHRFRTGDDYGSPHFLTVFDVQEGEDGLLEDDVRLDQVITREGDALWYEYDFGDGWNHRLVVEEVLADPPSAPICLAGEMACPPEDCGGIPGYEALAEWVRSGYSDARLPPAFDNAAHARQWLPPDWHPDHFDLAQTQAALVVASSEPAPVTGELADIAARLEYMGNRTLRIALTQPMSYEPAEVSEADAARLTETYRIFLDIVADGVSLTAAGRLPPAVVRTIADQTGLRQWWIGQANREDQTPPVTDIRETARALGLVSVRKGRLAPTAAVARIRENPVALWRHIVSRLPLGKDAAREAGWLTLAVAGSGVPASDWDGVVGDLMFTLGWRIAGFPDEPPSGDSPTLDVLEILAGRVRRGWRAPSKVDPAIAATARAAIRRT